MPQYKYQTKNGFQWMAKFNLRDENGTIQTIYKRGFQTKKDAKTYEENYFSSPAAATAGEPRRKQTFEDVFNEYMASHKNEEMKKSTVMTKTNIFENRIFPAFRDRPIDEITADEIARWQEETKNTKIKNGEKLSPSYLRTIQTQFNSVINYAYRKGYLTRDPLADIKNMGIKDKRIEFWTPDEYEKFAYAAMNYPEYYYAYEVLYWCGLREGEMLALTVRDIDFEARRIYITKSFQRIKSEDVISTPKTQSSVRTVQIPDFLCDELKEYIGMLYEPAADQRVFNLSKTSLHRNFHALSEEAGLKPITIHGLRHSHVSLLISKKYDIFEISRRIGHKSVKTTQDIYGHLFDDVQKSIANDLDDMRKKVSHE